MNEVLAACVRADCPSLYLCVDADARVVEANHHTRALLGEGAVGAPFASLVTTFEAHRSPRELARQGGVQRVNFLSFAGLPLSMQCAFREVGDRVVVLGALDAREQETLRVELLRSNQALANLARDLQRSNAELARLNELKSRFVGMAAHDLRSPLTTISSAAALLDDELVDLGAEHREDLSTLRTSAEFMRRLVDDFLSVALIEAGHLELRRRRLPVVELVDGALRVTSHAARRAHRVKVELDGPAVELDVDVARIEQVLMNLLNNAIEHSPPDSSVTLAFAVEGRRGVFTVRDQGRGIAHEVQDDLFKAFVHGADKSLAHRSAGLGLAIAKLVVDAHGGVISAASSDAGSTFTVALPLP